MNLRRNFVSCYISSQPGLIGFSIPTRFARRWMPSSCLSRHSGYADGRDLWWFRSYRRCSTSPWARWEWSSRTLSQSVPVRRPVWLPRSWFACYLWRTMICHCKRYRCCIPNPIRWCLSDRTTWRRRAFRFDRCSWCSWPTFGFDSWRSSLETLCCKFWPVTIMLNTRLVIVPVILLYQMKVSPPMCKGEGGRKDSGVLVLVFSSVFFYILNSY